MNKLVSLLHLLLLYAPSWSQSPGASVWDAASSERRTVSSLSNYDALSLSSNNFDVDYYRCNWTVDPAVRAIKGSVTTYFRITQPTASIVFDLADALLVDSVLYAGNRLAFSRTPINSLQVTFPAQLPAGRRDSVHIFYGGTPPITGGYFATGTHNATPILWTLSEPYGARTWWPCKDVLGDKPDSIDIIVTAPVAYRSSSNGLPLEEVVTATNRTTRWKHRYPIAPYLVAIAVTNYVVDNEQAVLGARVLPVTMYAYPESRTAFAAATATAIFCLQQFSPFLSEYPFMAERYAQTQFPVGGGMEHQTNSFIGSANAGLVAHELAHQWFGDKVTHGSWSDLWLNEGFATYMEYVYTALSNPSGRLAFLQGWKNNITAVPGGSVYVADTANVNRLFDGRLTYRKGGYVVHMLRWKLGDSTFFRGIRRYLNDPLLAYRTARTADLQRNLEAESGQSLARFFNDWVYGEGYPNYSAEWSTGGATTVRVTLSQTTSHPSVPFYEMPVPLQFRNATRDTILRVSHSQNGETFNLDPGFVPDTLIIDPQLHLLTGSNNTRRVAGSSQPAAFTVFPNPAIASFSVALPGERTDVQVFNAAGQRVYYATGNNNSTLRINTGGWARGVYWLHVQGSGARTVRTVLVL